MTSQDKGFVVFSLGGVDDDVPSIVRRGVDAVHRNMVYHPSYSDDTSHRGIYIDPGDEPLETRIRLVGFTDSPEERTLRVNNESNMSYTTIVEETSPGTFSELPLDEGFVRRGGVHEEPHPAVGIALSIEESRQTIMAVSTGQAALSRLYYTLTLSMSRESDTLPTPPSKQRKVPFCLRVDTGCNNSWVFDRKVCELRGTPNEPDAVSTLPTIKVAPGCWPSGRPALWKHSAQILATRLPVERDGDVVWTCTAERPYPIVRYGENSVVVLGLMQHPGREVLVQDCTSFNVEHNIAWERELKFPLRLGVVYAASPNILRDLRKHGFAGLGRSMTQITFGDSDSFSSSKTFAWAVADYVAPPKNGEDGYVLFFLLRRLYMKYPSYLAFNAWPCVAEVPTWMGPINVTLEHPTKWAVELAELVVDIKVYPRTPNAQDAHKVLKFDKGANHAVLDSGCSVSYLCMPLSLELIELFPDDGERANPGVYKVPDYVDLHASTVRFVFTTDRGPVPFEIGFHPFICNAKREGLVWTESPGSRYGMVLGLNFFQSAYVALHHPSPGTGKEPYVMLARQNEEDCDRYVLQPMRQT